MTEPKVGQKIPAFQAQGEDGPMTHKDLAGGKGLTVVYFYPKDDTPGCTTESCAFRDAFPDFKKLGVRVFGVSKDSLTSHAKFKAKYKLPFALISDEDGAMCDAFGVWVEKSMYGKKYTGIERSTFLVDSQGTLLQAWRKVKPETHVDEVFSFIKSL